MGRELLALLATYEQAAREYEQCADGIDIPIKVAYARDDAAIAVADQLLAMVRGGYVIAPL